MNVVVLLAENVWNGFFYIFPYILTLFIALWSVRYAQQRTYEQLLKNLLDEVKYNLDLCDILLGVIDNDLEMLIDNEESLFGLPLFYDGVWNSLRANGQPNRIEQPLYGKLMMLYQQIDITDRLLLSYEQRKRESKSDIELYRNEQNDRIKGVKCNISKNIRPLSCDAEKLWGISGENEK